MLLLVHKEDGVILLASAGEYEAMELKRSEGLVIKYGRKVLCALWEED